MIAVGQVWSANVKGKIPKREKLDVRLTWVSKDGKVAEAVTEKRVGRSFREVTLARCLLLELRQDVAHRDVKPEKSTIEAPVLGGSPGALPVQAGVRSGGTPGAASRGLVYANASKPQDGTARGEGDPAPVRTPEPVPSGWGSTEDHLAALREDLAAVGDQLGLFGGGKKAAKPKKKRKRSKGKGKPKGRVSKALRQWPEPEGPPRERDASPEEARLVKAIRLRPYQLEGAAWLAARRSAILADEPGVGKTAQLAAAIPVGAPVIVLCPSVARDGVWPRHVGWRPDLRSRIAGERRLVEFPHPGEVVIATYDSLPPWLDREDLLGRKAPEGCVVVLDEAHLVKNPKARRSKRCRRLLEAVRANGGSTWLVTGHPMKNKQPDLWALIVLAGLAEQTWRTEARFSRAFGRDPISGEWTGEPEESVPGILRSILLRREFADVVPDMPPRQWERVEVRIDPKVSKVADAVVEALAEAGVDLEEATAETLQSKKRNAAAGEFMTARKLLAAAKVPALLELVGQLEEESDRPLVVFSAHKAPLEVLAGRDGWEKVTGDESPSRRADLEAAFQAGELRGLAITIGPVSTAISLSAARRAIFVDRGWTPSDNEQAEGRVYRADDRTLGTDEPVLYTDLVADHPIDRRLADLLAVKREAAAATVGAAAVRVGGLPKLDPVEPTAAAKAPRQLRSPGPGRRPARSPLEYWAEESLGKLAQGEVSAIELPFFMTIAEEVGGGLTDQQWRGLIRACRRYVRLVGTPPVAATTRSA